jgi:hypothetical protein
MEENNTLSATAIADVCIPAPCCANIPYRINAHLIDPPCRLEDNIKMDLQEVGGGCGDWMERAQDRDRWRALVSTVMNFRVP